MSDHEFEKQVRQKLDDLRLTPTPEAWQKIEEGIRDTRRRRVPLLWLPLLLIGLVAGGYFLLEPSPKGETPDVKRQTADVKRQTPDGRRQTPEVRSETPDVKRQTPDGRRQTPDVRRETPDVKRQTPDGRRETPDARRQTPDVKRQTPDVRRETPDVKRQTPEVRRETPDVVILSEAKDQQQERSIITLTPIKPAFTSPNGPKLTAASRSVSSSPAPPRLLKKSKWSYGITAYAGMSGLNNGNLFRVKSAFTAEMQSPVNAAFAPSYTPYRIVSGAAFAAGVFVKREISKRFDLSLGLNYSQLNVKYRPGAQVYISPLNSTPPPPLNAGNFFRLDQHKARDYRNTYQFIELPVTLHTRVTKSQRLPVYWNTGVSYTRLVATNSKHFDGTTGLYYSNENLINKNQVAVSTGFDFVVTPKSKYPISVGPAVRYNVTPLTSEKFSDKRNLISTGVNLKVRLSK